jgi:periplasmic protein TorT
MKRSFTIMGATALALAAWTPRASAADWWPIPVTAIAADKSVSHFDYVPLTKAGQKWKLCVSFQHLKDANLIAYDYGIVEEAKRLGVEVQVVTANSDSDLAAQISTIENCVAGGAQAVIVLAISVDGLNNLVEELHKKNVPVVDFLNGMSSPLVAAHAFSSPYDQGKRLGKYLADEHPKGSAPVKAIYFPGPAGAGWVIDQVKGLKEELQNSSVDLIDVKYGDATKDVQTTMIEDALETYPDLNYVLAGAPGAEAAVPIIDEKGLKGKVKIASMYFSPGVYQGLKDGKIDATQVTQDLIMGHLAVDMTTRLLEGKLQAPSIFPAGKIVTSRDVNQFDIGWVLAPPNFKPVFDVK